MEIVEEVGILISLFMANISDFLFTSHRFGVSFTFDISMLILGEEGTQEGAMRRE